MPRTPFNPFEAPPLVAFDAAAGPGDSRVRYGVLTSLCLLAGILYLDRICISTAVPLIQSELGLTNTQVSFVLMSFTLAYGLFELPAGRWGDTLGSRRVLTRISIWWSVFTALTGTCHGLVSLIAVRFLFGAGEAGAFPNSARIITRWFPESERGRAQGMLLAASQLGGAVAPALSAYLIAGIGWRPTFAVFGSVGFVWAAGFWWWFRDDPGDHSQVSAAEREVIGDRPALMREHLPIPWAMVVRCPSFWLLCAIMACASFNSYIYFSWFPKYLAAARGVTAQGAGWLSSLVLLFATVGTFLGGWIVDALNVQASIFRRRFFGSVSFSFAVLMLGLSLASSNALLATICAALSCLATQATQPLWWLTAMNISGRHVGALCGLMNSTGVLGALLSQFLVGWLADVFAAQGLTGRAQWDPVFFIDLGVLTVAAMLWAGFVFQRVEVDGSDASVRSDRSDLPDSSDSPINRNA